MSDHQIQKVWIVCQRFVFMFSKIQIIINSSWRVTSCENLMNLSFLFSLFIAAIGAFLIYISSDYVFDGTNPPYREEDIPAPLNLYGKTKLEGEKAVLENNLGKI